MMERHYISHGERLNGYDVLRPIDLSSPSVDLDEDLLTQENSAFDAYQKMHKVFVGEAGGQALEVLAEQLEQSQLPRYLDAAGWAAAEAALVRHSLPAHERLCLLDRADRSWERALIIQQRLDSEAGYEDFREDSVSYRMALNIAYSPLMRSLVVGNVTDATRERVFADTLAIAQVSLVQLKLAETENDYEALGDHLGFQHECNALLSLLYLDDARYIPLPSSSRAGSGVYHRDQTHDISVLNQHWGDIRKVIPVEIKAAASLRDRQRYKALIVRGKMHLSVAGKHQPSDTLNAFAAVYERRSSPEDQKIVTHASETIRDLLRLYQQGGEARGIQRMDSRTKFHGTAALVSQYQEFSSNPR